MGLADKGGSSGLVGRRWADLCADWIDGQIGRQARVPAGDDPGFTIERVARLDDIPRIARIASKRGLQNPDILLAGSRDGRSVLQAADAKFSVETARSKQVSPEVVEALVALGSLVRSLTGELSDEIEYVPGVFLSPDYALTHLMMQGRPGIMRATVKPAEVILVPADPATFFTPLPASCVMPVLSEVDALPLGIEESLLAGLYYFRLARAGVGAWMDSVKPLLFLNDKIEVDETHLLAEAVRRADTARTAFELILDWDRDVEQIRARRAAVDQVTSLPIVTKDLRNAIAAVVDGRSMTPPSANQVRRRLGAWFRGEIRLVAGVVPPQTENFNGVLKELAAISADLAKQIPERTTLVIQELLADKANAIDADEEDHPDLPPMPE